MLNLDASANSNILNPSFGYTSITDVGLGESLDSLFQRHESLLSGPADDEIDESNFYSYSSGFGNLSSTYESIDGSTPTDFSARLNQQPETHPTTPIHHDALTGIYGGQSLVGDTEAAIADLKQALEGVLDQAAAAQAGNTEAAIAPEQMAFTNAVASTNNGASAHRLNGFSFSTVYGYGLVDAAAAVAWSQGYADLPDVADNLHSWSNNMINAPEVWNQGITGQGVTVAVIDSGVDITHPDLDDNIWVNSDEIWGDGIDNDFNGYVDDTFGWNFGNYNNDVFDYNGHGTHVAGTIAAEANGFGITGVAPGATIMPIKLSDIDSAGNFTSSNANLAEAIVYAVDNGANVINMSLSSTPSWELEQALAYAASNDVVTVTSSGNEGRFVPNSPASYSAWYGLSVGAVNQHNQVTDFSNQAGFDPATQYVVAPGDEILSTIPTYLSPWDTDYDRFSGTSMAAPHVAGTVALMLDANPYLTHDDVQAIVTGSAIG